MKNILDKIRSFILWLFRIFMPWTLKQDVKDLSETQHPKKRGPDTKSSSKSDKKNKESKIVPLKRSRIEHSQTSSSAKETEEDEDISEVDSLVHGVVADSQKSENKRKNKKNDKGNKKLVTDQQRQRQTSDKDAEKPKEISSGEAAAKFVEELDSDDEKPFDAKQKKPDSGASKTKRKSPKGQNAKAAVEKKKKEEDKNKRAAHDFERTKHKVSEKANSFRKTENNDAQSSTKSEAATDRGRKEASEMKDTSRAGSEHSRDRSRSHDGKGEKHEQTGHRSTCSTSSEHGGNDPGQGRNQGHGGSGQSRNQGHGGSGQSRNQGHGGSGQGRNQGHGGSGQGRNQGHGGSGQGRNEGHGDRGQGKKQGQSGSGQGRNQGQGDIGQGQYRNKGQSGPDRNQGHARNGQVASGTKSPGRVTLYDNYTSYFIPTDTPHHRLLDKAKVSEISQNGAPLQLLQISDKTLPYQKINIYGTEEQRQNYIQRISKETGIQNGFSVLNVKGDLFSCPPTESLAHCVSEDLEMGMGIAVEFKKKFGRVGELLAQEKTVGEVAVLKVDGRFIYYLITKSRYFHKPNYETLSDSLEAMKTHCVENRVTRLSMPQIGCGLDKLDWEVVVEYIYWVFRDTPITITSYRLK